MLLSNPVFTSETELHTNEHILQTSWCICGTPEMAYFSGYNGRKGFRELLVAQEWEMQRNSSKMSRWDWREMVCLVLDLAPLPHYPPLFGVSAGLALQLLLLLLPFLHSDSGGCCSQLQLLHPHPHCCSLQLLLLHAAAEVGRSPPGSWSAYIKRNENWTLQDMQCVQEKHSAHAHIYTPTTPTYILCLLVAWLF